MSTRHAPLGSLGGLVILTYGLVVVAAMLAMLYIAAGGGA